ncbi:MAG: anti-sigma factor C-terminal domain-containing protein [Bacillota bacterium]|nr:anti-sigma factor C-terminal domain-containing protein [Bacillota bacterium]
MSFRELMEKYKVGQATAEERRMVEEELEKFEAMNEFEYEKFDETVTEGTDTSIRKDNRNQDEEFTTSIRREIRRTFVRAGIITGAAVIAIVLFILFAMPRIADLFYYDPGQTIAVSEAGKEASNETNRMSLDMAVYTELMTPEALRDYVNVEGRGYGCYDINIIQTVTQDNEETRNVSGRIERNKLVIYDTNVINPLIGNSFGWYQREETGKTLRQQDEDEIKAGLITENEEICHGPITPDYNRQELEQLEEHRGYYAYVTLNKMMNYEDFISFFDKTDLGYGWCAVKTYEPAKDEKYRPKNLGFVFSPTSSASLQWDNEKYPQLRRTLSDTDEANYKHEDVAANHFISMLNYMSDNEKFCRMMKTDEIDFDPQSAAEYVKDNGLTIYGFVTRADRDKLLELLTCDEIYTVYVK